MLLPELPDLEGVVGEVEVDGELLLAALAQRVLGQVGAAVEPEWEGWGIDQVKSNVITRHESTPSEDMSLPPMGPSTIGKRHI